MRDRAAHRSALSVVSIVVFAALGCDGLTSRVPMGVRDESDAEMAVDANTDSNAETSIDASRDATPDVTTGSNARTEGTGDGSTGAIADARAESSALNANMGSVDAQVGSIADAGIEGNHPECDSATCPGGCCDADGICQPGVSAIACGGNGTACESCPVGSECGSCPPGYSCPAERFCGCTPQSCPTGCCAGGPFGAFGGTCQAGTVDSQCGSGGTRCEDCTQPSTACLNCPQSNSMAQGLMGQASVASGSCSNQQCVFPPVSTCLDGCVDALGQCQPGASNTACGNGGQACEDCTASGIGCFRQQCVDLGDAGVCNAQSCPTGCCDYATGQCRQGITGTACGRSGADCQDCVLRGQICSNQQTCTAPNGGLGCGAFNCNGCCDGNANCVPVNSDTQCGFAGSRCVDCTGLGDRCASGACTAADGGVACVQSCTGCCDVSGNCQLGAIDAECGQVGSACQDCTSLNPPSTCDLSVSPRTCASQQTTCPAPYPGCPLALQTPSPVRQMVCSPNDLQNAAAACTGGAHTLPCLTYLTFDLCGFCLAQFDYDFVTQVGISACVAPYLDATCNHNSACSADCVVQSCDACLDPAANAGARASTTGCDTQVQAGACAAYFQADQCVTQALDGPAAVCNPATYQNNFGAWLQGVGTQYCAQ